MLMWVLFQSLNTLNEKLEDDNRNLMMQLQALLTQNQELLTGCLDSKDQLAEEQKAYMLVTSSCSF